MVNNFNVGALRICPMKTIFPTHFQFCDDSLFLILEVVFDLNEGVVKSSISVIGGLEVLYNVDDIWRGEKRRDERKKKW